MKPKVALLAAFVYTFLFEVAKYGVGLYLEYAIQAYRYFYHGYTILVIIGIWAFYSAALLIISVIIAKAYQEVYVNDVHLSKNPYEAIS